MHIFWGRVFIWQQLGPWAAFRGVAGSCDGNTSCSGGDSGVASPLFARCKKCGPIMPEPVLLKKEHEFQGKNKIVVPKFQAMSLSLIPRRYGGHLNGNCPIIRVCNKHHAVQGGEHVCLPWHVNEEVHLQAAFAVLIGRLWSDPTLDNHQLLQVL